MKKMGKIETTVHKEFYIKLEVSGIAIGLYVVLAIVFAETGLLIGIMPS